MDRLTYDFQIGGSHCWQVKGADNLECREVCQRQEDRGCTDCPIAKAFDRLSAYEETGLEPGEIEQLKGEVFGLRLDKQELSALGPIDRLCELAQADKLIGKTVYYPYAEKILEKRVSHFIIYDERRANLPPKESWFCINDDKSETFGFEDIGKTVFLTREEAESALRREQDG